VFKRSIFTPASRFLAQLLEASAPFAKADQRDRYSNANKENN
jgi:hypothetical protein